jgi:putative sporulation protein YtxC
MTALALISIAVKHVTPGLKQKLEECVFFSQQAGYQAALEEKQIGQWPHMILNCCEAAAADKQFNNVFRRQLAEKLTHYIVAEQALPYLKYLLLHNYFYFPQDERKIILTLAEQKYSDNPGKNQGSLIYTEILHCLQEFLQRSDYINLHGLIIFRLRLWLKLLQQTVDKAVDDFLLEKEYQEFIKLLKYFVSLQQPKIDEIHVTVDAEGNFCLLDLQQQALDWERDIDWDSCEGSSDKEDQLVSILITAAPKQIILHRDVYTHYPRAADTLEHVFENRVSLCRHCKLCRALSKNTNYKGKN